jgi:hypothetical protein
MDGFPATPARRRAVAELQAEARQRLIAAGLTLEDAAAIAVDPLVRRRIAKALGELDEALGALADLAFGVNRFREDHSRAGEPVPTVGDWLAEGESALDLATAAMTRAGELEGDWREQSPDAAGAFRSKLDMLAGVVNGHGDSTPETAA